MRKEGLENYLSSSRCCERANARSYLFYVLRNVAILFTLLAFCSSAFSDDFSEPENVFTEDVFYESEENNKNVKYEESASETKFFSFSIEPLFGVKIGQVDEYVFLNNCDYADDKLSELNWEIKPEYYVGAKLSGEIYNIFVESSFFAGIPSKTGKMFDSDWFNVQYSGLEDYQYKTTYSESDNYLKKDFSFEIKVGYDFNFPEIKKIKINAKLFADFQYKNIKFDGKNGTQWYPKFLGNYYPEWSDSENVSINYMYGIPISYERWTYITWLGFDANVDFGKHFSASAGFKVSPYLYSESLDNHYWSDSSKSTSYNGGQYNYYSSSSKDYLDKTPGFFKAFNWNLGFALNINEHNSFLLNGEYFLMSLIRGDNYLKLSSAKTFLKSSDADGGAAERYFNISISYRLNL